MKIHQYNEMMRYLTRPKEDPSSEHQVAGLSDVFPGTFTSYNDAVYGGFQGTREEWLQQQSIPQSERPLAGAKGGRVYDTRKYFNRGQLVQPGPGRLGFDKGGTAEVIKYLNTLPDNTKITKKMVTDFVTKNDIKMSVQDFITRNIVKRNPKITSKIVYETKVMPIKVTDDLLKTIDYYVKETNLNLEEISEKVGRKLERSVDRTSRVSNLLQKYEDKYGTVPEERFGYRGLKLTEDSTKVKNIFELFDRGLSKTAIAKKLGYDRQDVKRIFHLFRPEDIEDPYPKKSETAKKVSKKIRIEKERAGTKILSKREKTFNINQRNLVKEINNIFKNNPKLILKDKNLTALLNLKLDGDGNIISKNNLI